MPWVREVNVVRVETTTRSVTAAELAYAARERFPALPAVEDTAEFPTQEQETAAQQVVSERWNAEMSG